MSVCREKPGVSDGRVSQPAAGNGQLSDRDPPPPDVISELTLTATPPPPPAWSDPPPAPPRHDSEVSGWPPEVRLAASGQAGHLDTDTESVRSSHSHSSAQSSVLVDMGKVTVNDKTDHDHQSRVKFSYLDLIVSHLSLTVVKVVGVLRSYPHDPDGLDDPEFDLDNCLSGAGSAESDYDLSDNFLSESPPATGRVCASCAQEAEDSSLLGDPLVYATFVANIQQYSTETEPSRQPSFNSRQPSFKQNSSEAELPSPAPGALPEVQPSLDHLSNVSFLFLIPYLSLSRFLYVRLLTLLKCKTWLSFLRSWIGSYCWSN